MDKMLPSVTIEIGPPMGILCHPTDCGHFIDKFSRILIL
jgi:hypothetical protein